MNSKQKGNRGEREWARVCREHGYDCRRSQQYAGGVDSADVIGLPGLHVEVKAWDTITTEDIRKFVAQAVKDSAGSNDIPIVAHKEDYRKWFISMEWQQFVNMFMQANTAGGIGIQIHPYEHICFVTTPADDWFDLYNEFYSGKKIEGVKPCSG